MRVPTQEYVRSGFIASQDVLLPKGPLEDFSHSIELHLRSLRLPTSLEKGVIHLIKEYQLKHRKRSSLICPSSPSHSKEFTKQVAGEGGKPSPRGSGEFPSEVVIVEGDKDAQDQFEDCVEQNIPELKQAPLLPSPEPIQPRHVRQCRSGFIASQDVLLPKGPLEDFSHSIELHLRSLRLPTSLEKGVIHLIKEYQVCKGYHKDLEVPSDEEGEDDDDKEDKTMEEDET
ncbi:Ribosomal protein LP0-like protein [Operophtera brumata]|uniref:Ribosomal protein LP0-like protein n=1 Tax=Operophtera brumata TaxID=104452 RepID=A0A0L7LL22_OPEBR|nr:Ribosomal protein LP0-like protein [Operophtera brumata]